MTSESITPNDGAARERTPPGGTAPRRGLRRVGLFTTGAALCALAGSLAGGLGSAPASDAAASTVLGLPSGFPSGLPAVPEFPAIAGLLLSRVAPGQSGAGTGAVGVSGTGRVSSTGSTGGLPPTGLPSIGSAGIPTTLPVPVSGLPGAGGAGLPPIPSGGIPPLPTTGLPIPPVGSVLASIPGVPALASGLPSGIPGLPTLPPLPPLPVGGLGGGVPPCVSTPGLPASPLGSLPATGGGSVSASSPLGGVTVTASTSGATVCAG